MLNKHSIPRKPHRVLVEGVDELAAALGAAVRTLDAFELRLDGTGVFPNARAPSVVWAA